MNGGYHGWGLVFAGDGFWVLSAVDYNVVAAVAEIENVVAGRGIVVSGVVDERDVAAVGTSAFAVVGSVAGGLVFEGQQAGVGCWEGVA